MYTALKKIPYKTNIHETAVGTCTANIYTQEGELRLFRSTVKIPMGPGVRWLL